jgi:hypothetical protein
MIGCGLASQGAADKPLDAARKQDLLSPLRFGTIRCGRFGDGSIPRHTRPNKPLIRSRFTEAAGRADFFIFQTRWRRPG